MIVDWLQKTISEIRELYGDRVLNNIKNVGPVTSISLKGFILKEKKEIGLSEYEYGYDYALFENREPILVVSRMEQFPVLDLGPSVTLNELLGDLSENDLYQSMLGAMFENPIPFLFF